MKEISNEFINLLKKMKIPIREWKTELEYQVRFRQVGQGDTIIVEKEDAHGIYLGIIDCKNDADGNNAALSYLDYLGIWKKPIYISFVIITHPHHDHYSGMAELFDRIAIDEKYGVEFIGHTLHLHPHFPHAGENNKTFIGKIRSSIKKFRKWASRPGYDTITSRTTVQLNKFRLEGLHPDMYALEDFIDPVERNNRNATQYANVLATAMALISDERYILLTSDVERNSFKDIQRLLNDKIPGKILIGAQIPHHGSEHNFDEEFWKNIKRKYVTDAVISVGRRDPTHPSPWVRKKLKEFRYCIKRTDAKENKLRKRINSDPSLVEVSTYIDPGENDQIIKVSKPLEVISDKP